MAYVWQYYDLVLVGIALILAVGTAIGVLTTVSMPVAVVVSAGAAAPIIGHGLFVNGPVDGPADLAEPVDALN